MDQVSSMSMRKAEYGHRWLIGMPLAALPLLLAATRPWFWAPVAGLFMVGAAVLVVTERRSTAEFMPSKKTTLLIALVLAYFFFQIMPLPGSWLSTLTPHRAMWLQQAQTIAGATGQWRSISYLPMESLFACLWWVFLALFALVLRRVLREDGSLSWFFITLFILVGCEAFYGILQVLVPALGVPGLEQGPSTHSGFARGTFINRNHYAAFLGMLWPLLLAYLVGLSGQSEQGATRAFTDAEKQRQLRQRQLFLAFVLGLVLLALFFSQSRGGILGALVAFTVFVVLSGNRRGRAAAFVAVCWMIMLAYGSIIGFDEIIARFDWAERDAPGRLKIWEDTWRMIQDHPWTGVGLESYTSAIRLYQSHLTDKFQVGHAHNDYLELVSELGAPMAVALIGLTWWYWWKKAFELKPRVPKVRTGGEWDRRGKGSRVHHLDAAGEEEERRLLAVGALAGSAAFLFHGWVEFNWQIPANQLYFVMLLVILSEAQKPKV